MIIFEKIRYRNFLSSGNSFTEIQLDRSKSTLIVGKNGAGKCVRLKSSYIEVTTENEKLHNELKAFVQRKKSQKS